MKRITLLTLAFILTSCLQSSAGLFKVRSVFKSNMVLQQGDGTTISGAGAPGSMVRVVFNKKTSNVKIDTKGTWKAPLDCDKYGGPHTLTVSSGGKTITLKNVLIGEVWIASGQSNMGHPVRATTAKAAIKGKKNPQIRLFAAHAKPGEYFTPHDEMQWFSTWNSLDAKSRGTQYSTAVGVAFAIELHKALNVPIGIMQNARGGVPIHAFMSEKTLRKDSRNDKLFKQLPAWQKEADAFDAKMKKWKTAVKKAKAQGKKAPGRPRMTPQMRTRIMRRCWPTLLYNTITCPLRFQNVRGVIWYQGESDAGAWDFYRDKLPQMMADWRALWHKLRMPFLIVQLARGNCRREMKAPEDSPWSRLQEVQMQIADSKPDVGIVASYDLPTRRDDIHYKDKWPLGKRLALLALNDVYKKPCVYSGPRYKGMKKEDGKIIISFTSIGKGLTVKSGENELKGFTIAGKDGKFVRAKAQISGDKVTVQSDKVAEPVAVRYAWARSYDGANLWSKNGLPAFPFRTDDWKTQTTVKKKR